MAASRCTMRQRTLFSVFLWLMNRCTLSFQRLREEPCARLVKRAIARFAIRLARFASLAFSCHPQKAPNTRHLNHLLPALLKFSLPRRSFSHEHFQLSKASAVADISQLVRMPEMAMVRARMTDLYSITPTHCKSALAIVILLHRKIILEHLKRVSFISSTHICQRSRAVTMALFIMRRMILVHACRMRPCV